MTKRRLWPYVLFIVMIAAYAGIYFQRNNLLDWVYLHQYQASSSISTLANETTMTDYGRRLFYVNQPALESKADFNSHCSDKAEQTAVLGCYHGNRQGIYLYDVQDERLFGVEQVTAAHEMLHQAYDRLSSKEKAHVQSMLNDFYASGLDDQAVKDKIEIYKKTDANVVNEMHSIFATEVTDLPADLEAYYSQYFTDRKAVVGYSDKYLAEFTRREQEVAAYDARLGELKPLIDAAKANLDNQRQAIDAKEKEVDQDVARNDVNEYNQDYRTYSAMIDAYNAKVAATTKQINEFNDIIAKRNAIAVQERQLQQALDSRTPVNQ